MSDPAKSNDTRAEVLRALDEAAVSFPNDADVHFRRGFLLNELRRPRDAIASLDRALELNPRSAEAHNSRGHAHAVVGDVDRALADFTQATSLKPDYWKAYSNRAGILIALERWDEALRDSSRAIELDPNSAAAHNNQSTALYELRRYDQALKSADRAISLNPNLADAYCNRGIILAAMWRHDEALASCDRAIAVRPDLVRAHRARGMVLQASQRFEEAAANCDKLLELDPSLAFLPGTHLYLKMQCCQWDGFEERCETLLRRLSAGEPVSGPYQVLAVPSSAAQQKTAAGRLFDERMSSITRATLDTKVRQGGKLRIGYFSDYFYNHAVSYLTAGLFEHHDRTKFEIIGFSYGPRRADSMRVRLEATFDRLIDVNGMTDLAVAELARDLRIDIAVDLIGFNERNRMEIFAHGVAPIQVNYLGYPGTTNPRMDYIIADPIVIPDGDSIHFHEKVVRLPHSYQVNDSRRVIAERTFTRAELGLPEAGFVFCCFNNNYKVTPDVFEIWMRLLKRVDGSVLWLLAGNPAAVINLRREAQKRGVSPERLIFADWTDLPNHLARLRAADLLLDTFYYGAHTTMSDALWVGVPAITRKGSAFPSRVGASLLTAIGLPDLVTESSERYEALAYELATAPERLASVRQRLRQNRTTHSLFDTRASARNIEAAYSKMWQRHEMGLPPADFQIEESAPSAAI